MFCQPLQMRLDLVAGLNMDSANRWQWRPDYEGLDLSECRRVRCTEMLASTPQHGANAILCIHVKRPGCLMPWAHVLQAQVELEKLRLARPAAVHACLHR